ncbi:DDB1A, partial [Symbiodinium sp. KB8]
MAYQYVVASQKPTSVTHAVKGHFVSRDVPTLVVVKVSRLEAHQVTEDGLEPLLDVAVNARIATVDCLPVQGGGPDKLLVVTERHEFMVLRYDPDTESFATECKGAQTLVSKDGSLVVMHLCDGALAVFQVNDGKLSPNPVHMRLEELEVLDLALAPGPEGHMLAVLSQDSNDNRHVSTYNISAGAASLQPGPWGSCAVDMNASTLIPHPAASAILVLGGEQVSCLSSAAAVHKPSPDFMDIAAWCALDSTMSTGQAWLVGLLGGDLCKLTFAPSGAAAAGEGAAGEPDVGVVQLGRTSTASAMVQVGAHEVFLGSCFGDSQSLELGEGDEPSVEVTATYTSLSPIVDMTVMDLDRQGQSQVVTASGAMGSGSLRVVRSGVGIDEEAVVPLPGITGMWGLRAGLADDHHAFLVQSFSSESSVLAIQEEQLTDVAIPGFVTSAASVHCATMLGDSLLQVTRSTVLLLDAKGSSGVRATWDAPADTPITLADASEQHVLLALQGGRVVLLSVQDAAGQPALNQVAETTMAYE